MVLRQPLRNFCRSKARKSTTRVHTLYILSLQPLHKVVEYRAGNRFRGVKIGGVDRSARGVWAGAVALARPGCLCAFGLELELRGRVRLPDRVRPSERALALHVGQMTDARRRRGDDDHRVGVLDVRRS
jgi:hypothetical protein